MVEQYDIIAEQNESTVVARYEVEERDNSAYQSEAQLENMLLRLLKNQGYDNPKITNETDLIKNLRVQLSKLNNYEFSDNEWKKLFEETICNPQLTIKDKTEYIQLEKHEVFSLEKDDGVSMNVKLIDKRNIHNNIVQVINQYQAPGTPQREEGHNRYDVTILVNGLPLVHIELKRRGVSIRQAFDQINRYQRESFWAGKALFEYAQLFVISNGTQTKYYSNTTRFAKEKESAQNRPNRRKVESNSFEFTSYWSDAENKVIFNLEDFAVTFLRKSCLLNIITKYCVYTVDEILMVMRPYQIAATERIIQRIKRGLYNKQQGTTKAGGYIWHTTGSGKTLTSFKTAQLATQIPGIAKVLFVVDRQDLDYQTMKEYDNFEKDCANGNTNWKKLYEQLKDEDAKIIITTIQKLTSFLKKKREIQTLDTTILDKNVVFIFDECHRSQFGEMHEAIKKNFKNILLHCFAAEYKRKKMLHKTLYVRLIDRCFCFSDFCRSNY